MTAKISASQVRYIKLGEGASWVKECLADNTLRIGFWLDQYFDLCTAGEWDKLGAQFASRGLDRKTVSRFAGEVRAVFEDAGDLLWVTFENQKLYWTFIDPSIAPWKADLGREGCYRKVIGWKSADIHGNELWMNALSGKLTKTAGFRGTSCAIEDPKYVVSRINGERRPEVIEAAQHAQSLEAVIAKLLQLLTWKDFELLVDLVFARSGWRRISATGKTQKTIDLDLILPTTGERAFVQVKSRSTQAEFDEYCRLFKESSYDCMFFVFHTGATISSTEHDVTILGPGDLAHLVMDAGLLYWVMAKVS